ncbi:polysaccharide deacetylase family protein [Bacillus sp. FJAT-27231]|uniref:polysaccharide deacetylase family protein n=1 Tax=Bacillus sp. FJAT-27231 TaxID=1679168 RepID=UPI0009E19738|nr:polysaccharide deacetylase family protein [Bacillus sp. FJAT-27231]
MDVDEYRENLLGVHEALPRILDIFEEYGIHATWATVGFLFFHSKEELMDDLPSVKPNYTSENFSPYGKLLSIGRNEAETPLYFAPSLIEKIVASPNQELGTHTFSHYYCLESGQSLEEFEADLKAAICIAKKYNHTLNTLIFPRNQVNKSYLALCKKHGIIAFRGNESHSVYEASPFKRNQTFAKKLVRLADSYINLTGHHIYCAANLERCPIINIPSSRFLRPFSSSLKALEPLRLKRITDSLTQAAKDHKIFHLWWHPHNFGKNIDENMDFLRGILDHYRYLQQKYEMRSLHMSEVAKLIAKRSGSKRNMFPLIKDLTPIS